MIVTYKDRKCDIQLNNVSYDYDYWCDAYIDSGTYVDTGETISDDIIDKMQDSDKMIDWIQEWLY